MWQGVAKTPALIRINRGAIRGLRQINFARALVPIVSNRQVKRRAET